MSLTASHESFSFRVLSLPLGRLSADPHDLDPTSANTFHERITPGSHSCLGPSLSILIADDIITIFRCRWHFKAIGSLLMMVVVRKERNGLISLDDRTVHRADPSL